MSLGNFALAGVVVALALYVAALLFGMISAGPIGLVGLGVLLFFAVILWGVLRQRMRDPEDRHYTQNVED